LRAHAPGQVLSFGEGDGCDYAGDEVTLGADGCASFTLRAPDGAFPVTLGAPGRHQVWNALAAAAAALTAGAFPEEVQQGLAAYIPDEGRMRLLNAPRGYAVIDDSYNANPAAVRATLECLAEMPGAQKVAILGDMRELGPTERDLHRQLGRYAVELGIDVLLAVGDLGREYVTGAQDARAHWYPDNAAAAQAAASLLYPGAVVLVKGSRAMRMEEIVAALLKGDG
jgi:UDP-N-acetylmuramoyl-tripeptide--D-alanyl-D-alanine ligase